MYKLIVNNVVVDVVNKLRYVRYIPELNKVVVTTPSAAHAICGSDNRTYYALPDVTIPEKKSYWKVVTVVEINDTEYNELSAALKHDKVVVPNYLLLLERSKKIEEMSDCCNQVIVSGFYCTLSDNKQYHFKLTVEDQINMLGLQKEIEQGAMSVLYHATDDVCKLYLADDMERIIQTATQHKKYHTTYFNLLKHCINNMYNIEEIQNITYGDDINKFDIENELKNVLGDIQNG